MNDFVHIRSRQSEEHANALTENKKLQKIIESKNNDIKEISKVFDKNMMDNTKLKDENAKLQNRLKEMTSSVSMLKNQENELHSKELEYRNKVKIEFQQVINKLRLLEEENSKLKQKISKTNSLSRNSSTKSTRCVSPIKTIMTDFKNALQKPKVKRASAQHEISIDLERQHSIQRIPDELKTPTKGSSQSVKQLIEAHFRTALNMSMDQQNKKLMSRIKNIDLNSKVVKIRGGEVGSAKLLQK